VPQILRKKFDEEHLDTLHVYDIGVGECEVLHHTDNEVTKVDTEALISAL
jgi:hypothetical protein